MSEELSKVFEEAASATADAATLDQLNEMADQAIALESQIADLEANLKVMNEAMNHLKTKAMPEIMKSIGLDLFVRGGRKFEIYGFVSGSLPKGEEERAKAIAWLEANDGAGLIKTQMSLAFGRSDREEAVRVFRLLKEAGAEPSVETGVHAATLQAFARERLRAGQVIDTDVLGLYTGEVVKIAEDKKSRGRK